MSALADDPTPTPTDDTNGVGDGMPSQDDQPNAGGDATPEGDAAPPASEVPEEYSDFTLPEGVEIDAGISSEFKTVAKELGLSQEKAQKLADLATKNAQTQAEAQARQWGELRESWVNGLKADKEFGGQKFDETAERANRALKRFGSDDLIGYLTSTGMGDYPELIKLLARVDRAVGEDSTAGDSQGLPQGEGDLASLLYPSQGKE